MSRSQDPSSLYTNKTIFLTTKHKTSKKTSDFHKPLALLIINPKPIL